MKGNLVTIVVLPYSKAHMLKMQLEAKEIECDLETVNLITGVVSSTVRVKILERDLEKALPIMGEFLGEEPREIKSPPEQKDRHILVPVDFSEHSERACKMAYNIASHLQVKMVFFHSYINPVIHNIPFSDVYAYDSTLVEKIQYAEKEANEKFQQFISKMSSEIGVEKWSLVPSEVVIKSGYADTDIVAYANKHQSGLIVIGSGGDNELQSPVGSVAVDIMYNAKVPVLVVPEETPEQELSEFSKILYATNFDEKDFTAIDKLMSIVKPFNVKVICAHVGQPSGYGWDLARLEGMKDILQKKYAGNQFDCQLIVGDDLLQSLENLIQEEDIDILSLTTHKRNMISRLFNPSIARKMIFHTHTPLLVFHSY